MVHISIIAGMLSTLLFVGSNIPMLWKAYWTKDLHSYSPLNIILANIGNLVYWVYVVTLPIGPIWLLHFFYTVTSIFMLVLLVRYSRDNLRFPGWIQIQIWLCRRVMPKTCQ